MGKPLGENMSRKALWGREVFIIIFKKLEALVAGEEGALFFGVKLFGVFTPATSRAPHVPKCQVLICEMAITVQGEVGNMLSLLKE